MWDPGVYQRFAAERSRPFVDLVTRIDAATPRAVVDLGCGPGDLTATLAARWPDARTAGLDSSASMIATARALGAPVDFTVADVADWRPGPDVDVVVCNAVLQWVPDHGDLLTRWAAELPAGAWLALQVPGNFAAPSHRELRAVAAEEPFADTVLPLLRSEPVLDPVTYADLLTGSGCAVDAWETTYVHQLPDETAEHPVLRWMDGTALRPVRAALDDADWQEFRRRLHRRLAAAYPVRRRTVHFPFRRVFVVARTGDARDQPTEERP